jgi:flagellar hook-length control protein FliK
MTTPVTTSAAPAARTAPAADGGGSDSAEPFASALEGALGAGRPDVDGAGAQAGGGPPAGQDEAADGDTATAAEPAAAAPTGVVAALWALLGGAAATIPAGDPGTPVAAGRGDGATPPGLAVAQLHAGGPAHGLRTKLAGEATSPDGAPAETAPAVPGAGRPTAPPPAAVGVRAAVEALAAAGVHEVVTETRTPGTDPDPAPLPGAVPAAVAPSTGDGEAAVAPTPSAPSSVLPVAATATAGGTSPDTGSGTGAGPGEDGTAPAEAVPTAGSAAPAAPAARAEAATGAAVAQPVSAQIARQVAVLRSGPDGSHTMTVVLTPETLGEVEVSVTVSQGIVELTLRGASEHGRAALLDAVPDLRRDLEAAGLTCSRLDVDRGSRDGGWSSSQQHDGRFGEPGTGGRGGSQERPDGGARPWQRSADTGEGRPATARTASGLDIRA